jgi:CHAD domain-containing protein
MRDGGRESLIELPPQGKESIIDQGETDSADAHEILADDPMSEAGRKILRLHFERMLAHEAGTRLGEDIEELHDMRVATRRMRAAFRVFNPFFTPKAIKPHLKGLKRTGWALGPVRDLDVFEDNASRYLATLPPERAGELAALLATWQTERQAARERMLAYLDSQRYTRFVKRFGRFLRTRNAGARPAPVGQPIPYQVQHIAPRLLYTRFEAVRAYEPLLDSASIELLHALRIDFKQLRYALEFFRSVLGREARMVIQEVKAMQDHLGDLNDADVAVRLLIEYLQRSPDSDEGLVTYLRDRERERARLLDTFPTAWEHYNRPKVSRNLALAIAAL